jgi:hypothetical protein
MPATGGEEMSKIKHPKAKKETSLKRDRRKALGDNSKAWRKAIPLQKALSHRATRRAATQATQALQTSPEPEVDVAADARLAAVRGWERVAFRKKPDKPLGERVARKLARRP